MSVGMRLKLARIEAGMSQGQLAKALGVTQAGVSSIEQGRTKKPRKIIEIAEALQVEPTWLLSGKGPKKSIEAIDAAVEKVVNLIFQSDEEDISRLWRMTNDNANNRMLDGDLRALWRGASHLVSVAGMQDVRLEWVKEAKET